MSELLQNIFLRVALKGMLFLIE